MGRHRTYRKERAQLCLDGAERTCVFVFKSWVPSGVRVLVSKRAARAKYVVPDCTDDRMVLGSHIRIDKARDEGGN